MTGRESEHGIQIDDSHLNVSKLKQDLEEYIQNPDEVEGAPLLQEASFTQENSISPTPERRPHLRILPAFPDKLVHVSDLTNPKVVTPQTGHVSKLLKRNDNRASIRIESELKQKIVDTAINTGFSTGLIIVSALRNAFPDSWENDEERRNFEKFYFHNNKPVSGKLNGHDLDSKYAQRIFNSISEDQKSGMNFMLPRDLKAFLEEKANDPKCMLSFRQLIETTLEWELDDKNDYIQYLTDQHNEPS